LYYIQRFRTKKNRLLLEKEKELDRMKSRFFANISHEFRTPLTLILGPIDDLIHKYEHSDIRQKLLVMKRNATRLLALVNQLLELSKIESGMLKLHMTRSDIIAVTKGITMSFHSIAEQKNIHLIMDMQPDRLHMSYDRQKWETILTNLLSNAFKFTQGNGKIGLSSRLEEESGKRVLKFTLTDNGHGIPKEQVHHIFNRFYQADSNEVLHHEGSGIGLALAKELVELHRGSIHVESEPGVGTKFSIVLPGDSIAKSPAYEDKQKLKATDLVDIQEVPDELEIEAEIVEQSKPIVLLIEDHVEVSNYIKEILSDVYNVYCAKDGEEGIIAGLEMIPDLIISDVMMPKKDGLEVCKTLKENEKTSHIPIILLTAKSDSKDKITGLSSEADDYITKPFVPGELLVRVKNLIESRRRLVEKYKINGILKPKDVTTNSIDEKFLDRLIELVELNISDEKFGVEQLGREIGMSRSQLHRKLTALIDQGPNQFIRSFRLQRAHDLLKQNAATASEISYQVGFSSPSYFTKCFHEQFGYTPTEMRTA
jgi:DNA-binding response OmpR family regulator/nitrogen-specific signal transduction histidine kinase